VYNLRPLGGNPSVPSIADTDCRRQHFLANPSAFGQNSDSVSARRNILIALNIIWSESTPFEKPCVLMPYAEQPLANKHNQDFKLQTDQPTVSALDSRRGSAARRTFQNQLRTSAGPVTRVLRAKSREGRIVHLRLECARVPPPAPQLGGWCTIMIDVSDEQRSARKLRRLQSQLEQLARLNTAGEMASNLAELRGFEASPTLSD
jgi:hypothetical protein